MDSLRCDAPKYAEDLTSRMEEFTRTPACWRTIIMAWNTTKKPDLITAAQWNTAVINNLGLYIYGTGWQYGWPTISIARVPGADQHVFVWTDKGHIHQRILCCGGCGAEITYDDLENACRQGDQALAELGAKIGSCEGGVLRRRIREILSDIEAVKFKAYLTDTRRSALSESLREDLG